MQTYWHQKQKACPQLLAQGLYSRSKQMGQLKSSTRGCGGPAPPGPATAAIAAAAPTHATAPLEYQPVLQSRQASNPAGQAPLVDGLCGRCNGAQAWGRPRGSESWTVTERNLPL